MLEYTATYKIVANTKKCTIEDRMQFTYTTAITKKEAMEQAKRQWIETENSLLKWLFEDEPIEIDEVKIRCVRTTDDRPLNTKEYTGMCAYIVELED